MINIGNNNNINNSTIGNNNNKNEKPKDNHWVSILISIITGLIVAGIVYFLGWN